MTRKIIAKMQPNNVCELFEQYGLIKQEYDAHVWDYLWPKIEAEVEQIESDLRDSGDYYHMSDREIEDLIETRTDAISCAHTLRLVTSKGINQ